jgi:hypothetical protein
VHVGEDARAVVITLTGARELTVPLSVPRRDVLDRSADLERLRGAVRAHLTAHARVR